MNIGWIKIILAVICELIWVTGLKYADLPWEWAFVAIALCAGTYFLITAANTLPVGTAYAVFVGLGSLGTVLVEFLAFDVVPGFMQIIFIVILMSGVIGLKLLNE